MTLPIGTRRRPGSLPIALLAATVLAGAAVSPCLAQDAATASSVSQQAAALPSGLAPTNQLVVGGYQLALDSNGNLFRSEKGKHWRQVHQQWDGKAVELLGIPALTAAPGSGQAPRPDTAEQEAYAAVLLRSTSSLHWVSVDRGKTWTRSTLDDVRRSDVKWSGPDQMAENQ
jgi:hypothetical protein